MSIWEILLWIVGIGIGLSVLPVVALIALYVVPIVLVGFGAYRGLRNHWEAVLIVGAIAGVIGLFLAKSENESKLQYGLQGFGIGSGGVLLIMGIGFMFSFLLGNAPSEVPDFPDSPPMAPSVPLDPIKPPPR